MKVFLGVSIGRMTRRGPSRLQGRSLGWLCSALITGTVALGGCANYSDADPNDQYGIVSGHQLVNRYCRYGSVSTAQLDGCLSHVTPSDVVHAHGPARAYAETYGRCRADSGPFCR